MKKVQTEQLIDKDKIKFVKLCAAIAAGLPVEAIESPLRTPETALARFLVMNYFKQTTDFALAVIGTETFDKDHSTVDYAIKQCKNLEDSNDELFVKMKTEFYKLINFETMEQLLKEAERREQERAKQSEEKAEELKKLHDYIRTYRKVVAKLIRTEQKPPSERDFALLDHILKY